MIFLFKKHIRGTKGRQILSYLDTTFINNSLQLQLYKQVQMSQEGKKQPRPFLKKGTRQYLSNATVRSLNQKPQIVEFGEEDGMAETKINANTLTFGRQQEQEIKIQVKRNTVKESREQKERNASKELIEKEKVNADSVERKKPKESKPWNQERVASTSISSAKKKPALLEDYIGLSTTSQPKKESVQPKKEIAQPKRVSPAVTTMAGQLSRQQEQLQDSNEEQIEKQEDLALTMTTKQKVQITKTKTPPKYSNITAVAKDDDENQICFNSDSEDEEPKVLKKPVVSKKEAMVRGKPNLNPVAYTAQPKWEEEHDEENEFLDTREGPSKVLQKYYQKEAPQRKQSNAIEPQPSLSLKDIPSTLKEQVINEYLISKKSDIQKKLQELQSQALKVKKEKERYQEENKRLAKEREEFAKEMQDKAKQFQEKMKAETSKLTREKRYMKDQQMTGKGDWKLKNQFQDMRCKYENAESEKKKLKAESAREIDRLKKKLQELSKQNDSLKNEMKFIEMQKIDMKQKSKQVEKKIEVQKKVNYWEGTPSTSYIYVLAEPTFTLLDLDVADLCYEKLEHYQYYLTKRDEEVELVSQECGSEKIKRKYKNGKEQIQYVGKVLKENFPPPFKFTVVNHINGDLKLIYPIGIHVYNDARSQITEFKIGTEKTIYNFHRLGQLQMKYKSTQLGEIHQLRKGNTLIRTSRKGEERFQRTFNGAIQRIS